MPSELPLTPPSPLLALFNPPRPCILYPRINAPLPSRNLIRPMLLTSLDAITHQYSTQLASRLPSLSTDIPGLLTTSPQTVVRPVGYRIVNLVPFDQPVSVSRLCNFLSAGCRRWLTALYFSASAVVFVGLIYMLILSFFIVVRPSLSPPTHRQFKDNSHYIDDSPRSSRGFSTLTNPIVKITSRPPTRVGDVWLFRFVGK